LSGPHARRVAAAGVAVDRRQRDQDAAVGGMARMRRAQGLEGGIDLPAGVLGDRQDIGVAGLPRA